MVQYTITRNNKGFEVVNLSEEQKQFINTYSPSNRFFTSADDIKKVVSAFELNGLDSRTLQAIRNSVVCYNHDTHSSEILSDEAYDRFNAMCSITAVIDNVKYSSK